ncbi:MAG TPA: serine/threonine-protein kinase [Oculatellaceae cyanobacterium]|jgi:serine/threonine protein kinase
MNKSLLNNRYQICKQLSKNAGRRTFLAQDSHSDNLVIIKILLFDQDFQWDELKLFEREAKILQNLEHPAIPQYLDYFQFQEGFYHAFALVQTYIDAPSLDTLIREGQKFTEAELRELADKLLDILNYLHGQIPVVIHRDIKPSNILLTNRSGNSIGNIYLVDFGSVQTAVTKESGTITIVGSYGYIPLEQFGGQAVPASDLYSLGMTIIYLATGTHPAELPQVNGQVQFSAPQLSKLVQKWLNKMIQPHLDRRFDSAKLAQTALNSPDDSCGNYPELRPKGTKVKLQRERERLEIILPPPFSPTFLFIVRISLSFIISLMTLAVWFAIVVFFAQIGVYLMSDYWLFLWCFCVFLFIMKNLTLPGDEFLNKIIVDSERINGFNNFNKKILTDLRSDISLLGYSPSYEFDSFHEFHNSAEREVKRGVVKTTAELFISAGLTKYSIIELSAAENWWIGQELSEFLDLELQIIYPTPRVVIYDNTDNT